MKLRAGAGSVYEPTAQDELWLLRAVAAEGAPRARVARALVNGFMLSRIRGSKGTLARFVRSYAQPVNPAWYPDGALFLAHPRTPAQMAAAVKRRDVHSAKSTFDAETRDAVARALNTPFPSDVTDYAAENVDATSKGYLSRSEPVRGENRFWTRAPGFAGYGLEAAAGVAVVLLVIATVWLGVRA